MSEKVGEERVVHEGMLDGQKMSLAIWIHTVNTPWLNPSQTGRYSICLPWRDGRLS